MCVDFDKISTLPLSFISSLKEKMERMWRCNMQRYHSLEGAQQKTALHERHPVIIVSLLILKLFFPISFLFVCCIPDNLLRSIFHLTNFQFWLLCCSLYWIIIPWSFFSFLEDQLLLFQVCLIISISIICPQCQFLYSIGSHCFYLSYIKVVMSEELGP